MYYRLSNGWRLSVGKEKSILRDNYVRLADVFMPERLARALGCDGDGRRLPDIPFGMRLPAGVPYTGYWHLRARQGQTLLFDHTHIVAVVHTRPRDILYAIAYRGRLPRFSPALPVVVTA